MIHVMLPVQYLRLAGKHRGAPERRLALAVLETVLHDCRSGTTRPGDAGSRPKDRRAFNRAMSYVMSRDRAWPYSFENVCETVGLDASYLRRGLRAAHQDGV
jgi:hypothetical protein